MLSMTLENGQVRNRDLYQQAGLSLCFDFTLYSFNTFDTLDALSARTSSHSLFDDRGVLKPPIAASSCSIIESPSFVSASELQSECIQCRVAHLQRFSFHRLIGPCLSRLTSHLSPCPQNS